MLPSIWSSLPPVPHIISVSFPLLNANFMAIAVSVVDGKVQETASAGSSISGSADSGNGLGKDAAKTLGETGGLGTVATRADIIEKLFNSFVVILVTS